MLKEINNYLLVHEFWKGFNGNSLKGVFEDLSGKE